MTNVLLLAILILLIHVSLQLSTLKRKVRNIMATLQDVQDDFAKFVADVKAKIDELQAKIDAGIAVEAADLDTLKTAIDAADAALNPPTP